MASYGENRPSCFVIMPFDPDFQKVWDDAIEPAVKAAGFDCVRGDTGFEPGSIMQFVIEQIFAADVIVADVTADKPNVFYELGIAHTIGEKTIMICGGGQTKDLPFDVAAYRAIPYQRKALAGLRSELEQALRTLQRRGPKERIPSSPVAHFGPPRPFAVPYRSVRSNRPLHEILGLDPETSACLSMESVDRRRFARQSDLTVLLHSLGPHTIQMEASTVDLTSLRTDLVVIGSPRFNPVAERVQELFDLPYGYVSARAKGDAISRDQVPVAKRSERVLRIVTRHGDELSASVDNCIADQSGGIDYGWIVLARLPNGKRLVWVSGIHGKGTLGAFQNLVRHADEARRALDDLTEGAPRAISYLVRVRYTAMAGELGLDGIEGERLGDPSECGLAQVHEKPRGVLLDLGDVVLKFDRERTYRAIGHMIGRSFLDVEAAIRRDNERTRLLVEYELGNLDSDAFCDRLADVCGGQDGLRERLPEFFADIFWPNYEMFEVLSFLKRKGVTLALVSNTNPLHFQRVQNDYPEIFALFQARSLSYEVRSTKPNEAILRDAIAKVTALKINVQDMLYVDDLEHHVKTMRGLGVNGFVYRSHSHFVFWLRQQGIHVPTIIEEPAHA